MTDLFYLQDSRSNTGTRAMFWSLGGGYTSNLDQAEQFTLDRALKKFENRDTDLPWPVPYVRQLSEVGVDCQYLTRSEAEVYRDDDRRVYVAHARDWDGNDLVWVGSRGPTSNLEDAIHPPASAAADYKRQGYELWPCGYIVERSRPVVRASQLDHAQAVAQSGIALPKAERRRIKQQVQNCGGCGRFLSAPQVYGDCPNCGEYNGP